MTKPAHITAIAPYRIYPAKMGGQKGIALFYAFLSKEVKLTLVSTRNNSHPENLHANFVPALSNSRLRYLNPFQYGFLKRLIKQHNSSHLILEHPYLGWLGAPLAYFNKLALVVHSHNIESLRFRSTGKWWWGILWNYEKWVHRRAAINFFITDEDRLFAIRKYKLKEHKCHTITYGIEWDTLHKPEKKQQARQSLQQLYGIQSHEKILFFNGTLNYKPNQDAVDNIIQHINPILLSAGYQYKIIICGKDLPVAYLKENNMLATNVHYAGFVDDIHIHFIGADIFINPVTDGGGIKTKLVEALGHNLHAVSTSNGAIGVPVNITGGKLTIIDEAGNWPGFAKAIMEQGDNGDIPPAFFEHFFWGNIAAKAARALIGQGHSS